jgi:threonine dehydrogenase-like Zn-dependent dehydrogenase
MKAVVFHGIGDIRLDDVPEPRIEAGSDAIVRVTASAICGTDLHMVRGTLPGMRPGTILGHEGVGVVEEVGDDVHNLEAGDRVVIPSTICCGACAYCRAGYTSQCDVANPNGPLAGTAFFGGPASSGSFDGLQAELARVPFANAGLIKLPEEVSDDQAIMLSDIFPTAYFAARMAEIGEGDTVAVFGCGPVGLFAIVSAHLLGAGRVLAVDAIPSRLAAARALGAEAVSFDEEHPVQAIRRLTNGIGVDRAIDAVGVDASAAPSQALAWAVDALAKAGTLSIVGVYPDSARFFRIGVAMNKNLCLNMGNCHHRTYIPRLVELVAAGVVDPSEVLSQREPIASAIDAYRAFDRREAGWLEVDLRPAGGAERLAA